MAVDVNRYLESLGDDAPCGPNLEYDAEFLALEEAARPQPGQEFSTGDGGERLTIEGQGVNWAEVRRLSEALMSRTRDLRVVVYFTRALLRTEGFVGILAGLQLTHGLLETWWDHVHPQLDPDDDNDPTMRINALAPLVASEAGIDDLRAAWLVRSRQYGTLTVRDIEVAQGKLNPRSGEQAMSESQVSGMLSAAIADDAGLAGRVGEAISALKALSSGLNERVGSDRAVDFRPLLTMLQSVQRVVPAAGEETAESTEAVGESEDVAPGAPARGRPGEISSRQDVVTTLERLIQYLDRAEPTNPAQLLLRRAQRVMDMSFLEALKELAPDGLVQAETSTGSSLAEE